MLTTLITIALSFFLGYIVSHYSLSTWGVRQPLTIVIGVIFGIFVAFIATITVSPVVGL